MSATDVGASGIHVETGQTLADQPGPGIRQKKERGEQLLARLSDRPDIDIVYEDESWFSRYAMPRYRTFSPVGAPSRLPIRQPPKREKRKAVAVYGALRINDGQILVRCADGQPNTKKTRAFLCWLLRETQRRGKKWLLVIWDHASWHRSLKGWVKTYNRAAGRTGKPRLMIRFLPVKSPWLNRIEPYWYHAKKEIYRIDRTPTVPELKEIIHRHFDPTKTQHFP